MEKIIKGGFVDDITVRDVDHPLESSIVAFTTIFFYFFLSIATGGNIDNTIGLIAVVGICYSFHAVYSHSGGMLSAIYTVAAVSATCIPNINITTNSTTMTILLIVAGVVLFLAISWWLIRTVDLLSNRLAIMTNVLAEMMFIFIEVALLNKIFAILHSV